MSSWAEMAKRSAAAPPPVTTKQQQTKKQKTTEETNKPGGSNQARHGAAVAAITKNGGSKQRAPASDKTRLPPNKAKAQQQSGKKVKQPPNIQHKQTSQKKKLNNSSPKSRKPTLKTMSLADVLPGNLASQKPKKQTKGATPVPQAPPQLSDFPSLATVRQAAPVWQSGSSVAILKRPGQGPMGQPGEETVKVKPANSAKPAKSVSEPGKSKAAAAVSDTRDSDKPVSSLAASMLGTRQERTLDEVGGEHALFRLMSQGKVPVQTKGRQRLKPRKKKFSSLKKKVLEERLRQWKDQNTEAEEDSQTQDIPSDNLAGTCTLCVYGFAEPELTQDDDEYEELCENLSEMVAKISNVDNRTLIPRGVLGRSSTDYPCFVEFTDTDFVQAALSCWNGLALGGQALRVEPVPVPKGITDLGEWKAQCIEIENISRNKREGEELNFSSTVILNGILTEDDIEDEDCLEETLADIKAIGQEFGKVEHLSADSQSRSVLIVYEGGVSVAKQAVTGLEGKVLGGSLIKPSLVDTKRAGGSQGGVSVILHEILTQDDLEDEECLQETLDDIRRIATEFGEVQDLNAQKDTFNVILQLQGGIDVAHRAAEGLSKKVIGGSQINAIVRVPDASNRSCSIILKGVLSEDDLEDEDCLGESLRDLKELATQFGEVQSIRKEGNTVIVGYTTEAAASSAVSGFNGMIIGGQAIEVILQDASTDNMEIDEGTNEGDKNSSSDNGTQGPLFSGDKRIPDRFAECLRVPKIPVATGGPRKYATLLNDDSVKPLIIEMLGELMRLQKRAIDDKNAKARRRLVMGFREVHRGVRARKVKLVIMANNLDDQYGAIDEKLQEILDLCHNEGVPVLFEMNKKGIGKALGKTIKVAVVGVQNADGANAQFKKLCKIAQ